MGICKKRDRVSVSVRLCGGKGGCLSDFGGVSKLMGACFCVSVFVYAYGSGCKVGECLL